MKQNETKEVEIVPFTTSATLGEKHLFISFAYLLPLTALPVGCLELSPPPPLFPPALNHSYQSLHV